MSEIQPFRVLFLCTGNSARSIFGEFLMRKIGKGTFVTFSAGSFPRGVVHPLTLEILQEFYKVDVSAARSKSVEEFIGQDFDYVITVCDKARENCPVWPKSTVVAHWGSPDPASFEGTEAEKLVYFQKVAGQIQRRIELMCCLPLRTLDQARRERLTREIGEKEKLSGQPWP